MAISNFFNICKNANIEFLLKNKFSQYKVLIWIGLIVTIIVGVAVFSFTKSYYEEEAKQLFKEEIKNNADAAKRRIEKYENLLLSGAALFHANRNEITRDEWHQFIQTLEIEKNYPGIQGIGLSMMLKPEEMEPIVRKMHQEGDPLFHIKPVGKREIYSSILYLEPMEKRNAQAIGYDMYSEPVRRLAMQKARDTGQMKITGKVKLVQEIDSDVQAGFLMYFPLYKTGAKTDTIEERRNALVGFVYTPFRMNELVKSLNVNNRSFNFEIYDGEKSEETLLYRSVEPSVSQSNHKYEEIMHIGGRRWLICYSSTDMFDMTNGSGHHVFLSLAIFLFYIFLMFIIFKLLYNRTILNQQKNHIEINRSWLSMMLKSSIDGIHIIDIEGRLIEYSPSFLNMLGYMEDESVGLNVYDWDARYSKDQIYYIMESISKEPIMIETLYRRKDGKLIDVEITVREIILNEKRYIYASSREITERKLAERLLLQEKETAQNYLDIVDVIMLVCDINLNIQLVNRYGCEIIGYKAEEIIGKNWIEELLPVSAQGEVNEIIARLLKLDDSIYHESAVLTNNGKERFVAWRMRILCDKDNSIIGFLCSGDDITEIRNIQSKLQESEVFYRTIFSSVGKAVLILHDEIIVDSNELASDYFSISKEEMIGKSIFDLVHNIECNGGSFDYYLNDAYQGKNSTAECTLNLTNKELETKIFEFMFSSFGSQDENKIIIMARDISKRVEEERVLKMHARQAQMGEMISVIAHQWRQPLAIINAITAQMRLKLMMDEDADPSITNKLITIEEQSNHLSQTISEYRDFFHPNKPKEHFTLSSVLNNAINLVDYALKNHSIELEIEVKDDPILFSYRNEVLQVIIALLKNALDAFEGKVIQHKKILISIEKDGEYAKIAILDNAGGIPVEVLERIFLPYFTTKDQDSGTGIGLHMSKMIIEGHCKGLIFATNKDNNAVFTVKLPLECKQLCTLKIF